MSFPAIVNLGALTPDQGFRLDGLAAGDFFGWAADGIGDYNGDGIGDFIVTAREGNGNAAGAAFIIFGQSGGFAGGIDLANLESSEGFRINALANANFLGWAAAGGADINGDGRDDLMVSAIGAPFGDLSGHVYVIFGGTSFASPATALSELDGTNGFRLVGGEPDAFAGWSVDMGGDFNGDGFEDLVVTAYSANSNGQNAGSVWVIYGRDGDFNASINLADLNGVNGFRVNGGGAGAQLGVDASIIGDVNGDGYGDLLMGAAGANNAYVLFGRGAMSASSSVASLNGTNGFTLVGAAAGDRTGMGVASAGDINGDGLMDVVVGAYAADTNGSASGNTYVVFGRASGWTSSLNLAALDGTNGFRIGGVTTNDRSGRDVQFVGDVNGDGYEDLLVGGRGSDVAGADAGAGYLIYGKASGFTAVFNLAGIDGTNGFRLHGAAPGDQAGSAVAGLGDINGDGIDDFYVSAPYADAAGDLTGSGYVLYGQAATRDFVGTSAAETFSGGALADTILGQGGDDILRGLGGEDEISGGQGDDQLFGGEGADTLTGGAGNDLIDGGVGADVMTGGAGNDVFLVDDTGDTASEGAGGGSDRVRATASFALGANIEALNLEGTGDISGTGNDLANQIHGNSGANIISGGGGADVIKGNAGADTLNGDAGADILSGGDDIDAINGGADNDIITGDAGNDSLRGGDGLDRLEGGAGADSLWGDAGNDQLFGGEDADILIGGEGNDYLEGGAGNDTLEGGLGDDTYLVDGTDTLIELLNAGNDIVRASVTWTLGANFERLVLLGSSSLDGSGNALGNTLHGNSGDNRLDGGAGADLLYGDAGIDTLIGGTGADVLSGGTGADRFLIQQASVFLSTDPQGRTVETDTISDFSTADGDSIDLVAIDAIAATTGDDAFTLVSAFDGQAGRMTLSFAGGVTTLSLDVDGDRITDYRLRINGDVTGDSGNWAL